MLINSLDPIVSENSKILILGIMPSISSLDSQQYYNNPKNVFWDIIFRVFQSNNYEINATEISYDEKIKFLHSNKIAVWDILNNCERKGNLDKDITKSSNNNFLDFFSKYPNIKHIYFNGQDAYKYFRQNMTEKIIYENRTFTILPSTSPTNQTNCFRKLDEWRVIKNYA